MTETSSVEAFAMIQGEERDVYVSGFPFVFGRKSERSPKNFMDICMNGPDKTISREYAILDYNKDEKAYTIDVKGKMGVYVNKVLIAKNEKCYIYNGDAVSMAGCYFYFILPTMVNDKKEAESIPTIASQKREAPETDDKPIDKESKLQEYCVC